MFTTSRPPGRSTRCSSERAAAGSTAAWHSTSAATAPSKLTSANGRAWMLARVTAAPLFCAARWTASPDHSTPASARSGRAARSRPAGRRCRSRHQACGRGRRRAHRPDGHAGRGTTTSALRLCPSGRILAAPCRTFGEEEKEGQGRALAFLHFFFFFFFAFKKGSARCSRSSSPDSFASSGLPGLMTDTWQLSAASTSWR